MGSSPNPPPKKSPTAFRCRPGLFAFIKKHEGAPQCKNLLFSLNATMPVFFVMVVGYLLGQMGFLPPAFCKAADKLCFKVTLPVMLFLDMGSVDILHDFQPRFVLFCFAATLIGILACLGRGQALPEGQNSGGGVCAGGLPQQRRRAGRGVHPEHLRQCGHGPADDSGQRAAVQHFCRAYLNDGIPLQRSTPSAGQLLRGVATNPILLGIIFWHSLCAAALHAAPDGHQDHEQPCVLTTPLSLLSIGASFEGTKAIQKLGPTVAAAFIKTVVWRRCFCPVQ